jgi:hypothetical protein
VNALGEMQLYHIQKFTEPDHITKAFECSTDERGSIHIEKTEQEFTLLAPRVLIGDVIGDPFNENTSKCKPSYETGS